jgi:membrane-associated phospholipid phosphatase
MNLFYVGNRFYVFIFLILPLFLFYPYSWIYAYYYTGMIVNITVNIGLKGIFAQPRPRKIVSPLPFDEFGMPSGHSQLSSFLMVFSGMYFQNEYIICGFLLLTVYTMTERIVNTFHTWEQTVVGFLIGASLGYLFFKGMQEKIVGNLTTKADDNAFIFN